MEFTAPLTFQEIMDEEYARKLQESYENEIAMYSNPSQDEQDFILALELSRKESEIQERPTPPEQCEQLTEDYLIALHLQEEINQEEREHIQVLNRQNGNSGVKLVSPYEQLFRDSPRILHTGDSDEEEEEDYYQEDVHSKKSRKPQGRTPTKETPKRIIQESNEIISKHNPEICGSKNTDVLESQTSIDCGDLAGNKIQLSNPIFNELNQHAIKAETRRIRKQGKEDRETREGVMDTQTRLLLYKMLNSGKITDIDGILSSGKEANVYSATSGDDNNQFFAIKIYKTTLNEFKNRDDYIKDDYRFRYRYNKQSSKKFMKVWAEKEYENLKTLRRFDIPCPDVILLRNNILVMTLIGNSKEEPAPKLLYAVNELSDEAIFSLFIQFIHIVRDMFQKAHLVHGDLSEYNILCHNGKLFIIDVAQAVEFEHPNALFFLRRDCSNMIHFFRKCGVTNGISVRELFNFITDQRITEDNQDFILNQVLEASQDRVLTEEQLHDEKVFLESSIPRHLCDVEDPFDEKESFLKGLNKDIFHHTLTGINDKLSGISDPLMDDDEEFFNLPETQSDSWVEKETVPKDILKAQRKEAKKLTKIKQRENRKERKGTPKTPSD